eukprot:3033312-Prymnesium_polylepis.2
MGPAPFAPPPSLRPPLRPLLFRWATRSSLSYGNAPTLMWQCAHPHMADGRRDPLSRGVLHHADGRGRTLGRARSLPNIASALPP